jgi:hypothetical protein
MTIPPEVGLLIFAMFAVGWLGLSIALRVKLRGALEPLSRSTRWWVRGLTLCVIAALVAIGLLFRRVFAV